MFFVHLSLLVSQSFSEDRSLANHIDTTSHQFVAVDECLCAYGKSHVWLVLPDFSQTQGLKAVRYVTFALQIWFHYLFSDISLPMRKDNMLEQYLCTATWWTEKALILFCFKASFHISPLSNKIRGLGTSETTPFVASFTKKVKYIQHNAWRGWSLHLEYSFLMEASWQTDNLNFSIKTTFVWNNFSDSTLKHNWTSNRK